MPLSLHPGYQPRAWAQRKNHTTTTIRGGGAGRPAGRPRPATLAPETRHLLGLFALCDFGRCRLSQRLAAVCPFPSTSMRALIGEIPLSESRNSLTDGSSGSEWVRLQQDPPRERCVDHTKKVRQERLPVLRVPDPGRCRMSQWLAAVCQNVEMRARAAPDSSKGSARSRISTF